MFLGEVKEVKEISSLCSLGELKDNSFTAKFKAECTLHPKVSSFNFFASLRRRRNFNFIYFFNSQNLNEFIYFEFSQYGILSFPR